MTTNFQPCEYYDVTDAFPSPKPNSFNIIHINIRSLQKNFDSLQEFLSLLSNRPQIICLSESRINQVPLINIELPDYKIFHDDSTTRAGGVAIYILNNISTDIISKFHLNTDGCENLWIKINAVDMILGVIYRHPKSSIKLFLEELNKNLEQMKNSNLYIIGDINLDISENSSAEYIDMLASNGYFPLISVPTRVTDTSSTIIDHIITNDHNHCILPGVIKTDMLSDHFPIFCSIDMHKPYIKPQQIVFQRNLLNFNREKFCEKLQHSLLDFFHSLNVINPINFNIVFGDFIDIIAKTIDLHAPNRKLSRKERKLKSKPWITNTLLASIKNKQKLYITHFLKGNTEQKSYYKKYANKLNKVKAAAKKKYYEEELKHSQNDTYGTWRIIKSLLSSSNKSSTIPEKVKHNDCLYTDLNDITEQFNEYFANVGNNLAARITPHDENAYKKYLPLSISSSLFLVPISPFEVMQQIHSLKNKKSCGCDNIATYFVILAANVLANPLSILLNYSFEFGIFPECLKTAKIIPIFKSGDKNEINNYRPISILSIFSKILEKLIAIRTRKFLEKHSILMPTQYGFRPMHSTSHAMLDVLTASFDNINHKKYTALLFLDLKKAFDTVNHKILISKLQHYGIRGAAKELFTSFLTNRLQYVSINNVQSRKISTNCGVPQGSVLGPLLFTLYINDIYKCASCDPKLFADDTCFILQHDSLDNLNAKINEVMDAVNNWMNANKLTLNVSKSNILLINPKGNNGFNCNSSITMTSTIQTELSIVDKAKYLGVMFDDKLSFKSHISNLEKKLSRSVGILAKVKPFLNTKALLQLYYAIFHSHLNYGIIAWSSTYKSYFNKLGTLQNKAVKIIGGGKYYDRATPYYAQLRILKLADLMMFEKALFVFKFKSLALPAQFRHYFTALKNVYQRSSRATNQNKYFIPFIRTSKLQKSIKYQGPLIWNSLDENIRNCKSVKSFKNKLKNSILQKYILTQ